MRAHVWQLRSRRCFQVLERAFYRGCSKFGARLCQFSVQHNHVHMLVEAADAAALARSLQGMCISMAKGLNRLMSRKGTVFADRYHARPLRTPTEVRNALVYVLANGRKHLPRVGHRLPSLWIDAYSSAGWFSGWSVPLAAPFGPGPVVAAQTWLLSEGYLRAGGPLRPDETPASPARPTPRPAPQDR